jgi:hypothetical protein
MDVRVDIYHLDIADWHFFASPADVPGPRRLHPQTDEEAVARPSDGD